MIQPKQSTFNVIFISMREIFKYEINRISEVLQFVWITTAIRNSCDESFSLLLCREQYIQNDASGNRPSISFFSFFSKGTHVEF